MLFRTFRLVLATMILVCCRNEQVKNEVVVSHGRKDSGMVGKEVELKTNQFIDFRSLLNRVDQITCNDSIPIIKVERDKVRHIFYINLPCWDDHDIYDYSQSNVLIIHNDSIEKRLINPWVNSKYPLNDLGIVLEKDLTNKGRDANWSISPTKHILQISVSEKKLELLPVIFSELVEALEQISLEVEIRIWLIDYLPHYIPPDPPSLNNN